MPPRRKPVKKPRKAKAKRKPAPGRQPSEGRVGGKDRERVAALWMQGGLSVRKISEMTGVGRTSVQQICRAVAQQVLDEMPDGEGFADRWADARAMRLEAIADEIGTLEDEVAAAGKVRQKLKGDLGALKEWVRLTEVIDGLRARASALRQEQAGVRAMPPPAEVLEAEVEAARRKVVGTPAGEAA